MRQPITEPEQQFTPTLIYKAFHEAISAIVKAKIEAKSSDIHRLELI